MEKKVRLFQGEDHWGRNPSLNNGHLYRTLFFKYKYTLKVYSAFVSA